MIDIEVLRAEIEGLIPQEDIYIADLTLIQNKLTVSLDSDTQVTIQDCAKVGRGLGKYLEEKGEDLELMVSSFGLDNAFIHERQFLKRLNKKVKVKANNGDIFEGYLTEFSFNNFVVVTPIGPFSKTQLKKNPELDKPIKLEFSQIKEVKPLITFNI